MFVGNEISKVTPHFPVRNVEMKITVPFLEVFISYLYSSFRFLRSFASMLNASPEFSEQGPVVRTPVGANPELNFNPGFFFFLSKALYRIIFSILFRVSNRQIVGKEN